MSTINETTFPIETFFPEKSYKETWNQRPDLRAMYLIALKQPTPTILQHLKSPDYQEPDYGLTALTVATMMRRHDIMEKLLTDCKVDPSPRDWGQLTPLHYACALNDQKAMELLQKAQKVEKIKTDVFDIFPGWKKVRKPIFPKDEEIVFRYAENGIIKDGTAKKFSNINNGATFYDGICEKEGSLIDQFVQRLKRQFFHKHPSYQPLNEKFQKELESQNPAKLYVAPQGAAGNGVFTEESLKKGRSIGLIYGGSLIPDDAEEENIDYQLDLIDASNIRNLGPIVNDSFPNTDFFPLYLEDGRILPLFIPLRDIKKGEPLFWNYRAGHPIKEKKHEELNKKEMEEFTSKISISTRFKNLDNWSKRLKKNQSSTELDLEELWSREAERFKLEYLFHTPSSLYYLYSKKLVTHKDLKEILIHPRAKFIFDLNHYPYSERILNNCLLTIEKIDQLKNKKLVTEIKEFIGKHSEESSFRSLDAFLHYFRHYLSQWNQEKNSYPQGIEVIEDLYLNFIDKDQPSKTEIDNLKKKTTTLPTPLKEYLCECFEAALEKIKKDDLIKTLREVLK